MQGAIHTIKGDNSQNAFFPELCPFLDRLFILYQVPDSRALAPACGALFLYFESFEIKTMFDWLYHMAYFQT